jgi:Fe-S-cluster containining protein
MTTETRQQRRQRLRQLRKRGETLLRSGLGTRPPGEDIAAVASVLADKLADETLRTRASDAADATHRLIEISSNADHGMPQVACRKGCGFCCHTYVAITVPEAFLLARAVRERNKRGAPPSLENVQAGIARLAGLGPDQRFGRKLPCPLLVEDACSVHPSRPTVCRQVASFKLEPCIEEYEGKGGDMQVPQRYLAHATNAQIALLAALRASGLPTVSYELSLALGVALSTPDAEARWLNGEDIFAGLPVAASLPQAYRDQIEKVSQQVAG